jgi:Ca2+-binding RTX toxin-like protein
MSPKSFSVKWATLTVAVAAMVSLAIPAAAGAAVNSDVQGNLLTVSSDGAADTITLSVALVGNPPVPKIAVNGTATALDSGANAEIVVNAGGGADVVDASALGAADYQALTVNGGEGDDTLTGGVDNDTLRGDAGGDRVIGFRGGDNMSGGEGDDVLVWNNGDGSDIANGEGGTDEVEVNGSPTAGDAFSYKPGAAAGRVAFERTNLGKFTIDLEAERLGLNGLGGEDVMAPDPAVPTGLNGRTALALDGGTGADQLTGGDGADVVNAGPGADLTSGGPGADLLNGGDDNDRLAGDGGDDRLVGDRGTDQLLGVDGDDTLVWNNGDGSDEELGGAGFDRLEVNGATPAGDELKLFAEGGVTKFERVNLVKFTLTMPAVEGRGGIEAASINGGGGNDVLTVSAGLGDLSVSSDGGAGNDRLVGAEEADSFFGGSGDDMLTTGKGRDVADGQDGADQLFARDGIGDVVRGGAGIDSAQTDAVTLDSVDGVENLDASRQAVPLPRLGKVKVVRSGRKLIAKVPVSCPMQQTGGCRTTLTLETARAARLGKVRAVVVLGSKTVRLRPGGKATASIRLASGASELSARGKLAARIRIANSDAAGNTAIRTRPITLRVPRR